MSTHATSCRPVDIETFRQNVDAIGRFCEAVQECPARTEAELQYIKWQISTIWRDPEGGV